VCAWLQALARLLLSSPDILLLDEVGARGGPARGAIPPNTDVLSMLVPLIAGVFLHPPTP
jgi:hypothetical protein